MPSWTRPVCQLSLPPCHTSSALMDLAFSLNVKVSRGYPYKTLMSQVAPFQMNSETLFFFFFLSFFGGVGWVKL